MTWAEIDQIGQSGIASDVFSVGDTKPFQIKDETFDAQIAGFLIDDMQDGGKAAITFGLVQLLNDDYFMCDSDCGNKHGFTGTQMYGHLEYDVFQYIPDDLQAVLKTVKKSVADTYGSTPKLKVEETEFFCFSATELAGTSAPSQYVLTEGTQYPLFTNKSSRIKSTQDGRNRGASWWTRSPNITNKIGYARVGPSGDVLADANSEDYMYVCLGFCV